MPKKLQATVGIALVLRRAHKAERSGRGAGSAHRHPEGVVEHGVGDRLAGVGYPSSAAEGVAVVELAGAAGSLANAGRVDGSCVLEDRACDAGAIGDDGRGSGAILTPRLTPRPDPYKYISGRHYRQNSTENRSPEHPRTA